MRKKGLLSIAVLLILTVCIGLPVFFSKSVKASDNVNLSSVQSEISYAADSRTENSPYPDTDISVSGNKLAPKHMPYHENSDYGVIPLD